jgi:hypothetical protein
LINEYLIKDTLHVIDQNYMHEHIRWMKLAGYIARMAGKPAKIHVYLWYGNMKGRNHLEEQDMGLHRGA